MERDIELRNVISEIWFPIPIERLNDETPQDSPLRRKLINRTCELQGMWCHISNGNGVFLTSDRNFVKQTKLPALIELGAGSISNPCAYDS